jgi:hypothetical protein
VRKFKSDLLELPIFRKRFATVPVMCLHCNITADLNDSFLCRRCTEYLGESSLAFAVDALLDRLTEDQ